MTRTDVLEWVSPAQRQLPGLVVTTWMRGSDMAKRMCSIEGCENPHSCRGWCDKHYRRWRAHGDPLHVEVILDDIDLRFWSKVDKAGACWLWTAGTSHDGYGEFAAPAGTSRYAHRWAYEQIVGPIPEGFDLDHVCHSVSETCPGGSSCPHRRCVNPAHLEPVTCRENLLRGKTVTAANAAKQRCVNGHAYDSQNTRVTRDGHRECRACDREKHQRRRDETRAAMNERSTP